MMGATVELHIDDDVQAISLDRDRIGLAFRNVIANALDAAAQRTDQPPSVAIELKRESRSHIRITVRDTGYGISLDMIERIFDPFYSGKAHGMGLGLAVSRSIVESHGGRLWAEPGNTGIVHFRLPA